jgi:hypothetical protein
VYVDVFEAERDPLDEGVKASRSLLIMYSCDGFDTSVTLEYVEICISIFRRGFVSSWK